MEVEIIARLAGGFKSDARIVSNERNEAHGISGNKTRGDLNPAKKE